MSDPAGPARALMGAVEGARSDQLGPEDFARLYQKHWRALWCVAVGVVGDRTLAQDVVQQAAVVGLERLSTFDPDTSFTAWMMQIVRNIALNEGRKRGRRRAVALQSDGTSDGTERLHDNRTMNSTASSSSAASTFDDQLERALDRLEETARACLIMRIVLNMPYREIATALDVPEGTAASHVHRARAALRDALRSADAEVRP